MRASHLYLTLALVTCSMSFGSAHATHAARPAEAYLIEGKLQDGVDALKEQVAQNGDDDQARFELGTLQVLRAVERTVQGMHRYGARGQAMPLLPFFRLPIPDNPNPEVVRNTDVRELLQRFVSDLEEAEKTLRPIDGDVKMRLRFGLIRMDFDNDGDAEDDEMLWNIYKRLNRRVRNVDDEQAKQFVIAFDRGDVHWLRGYCHLLMAVGDAVLAHDWSRMFNTTGHALFVKAETKLKPYLKHNSPFDGFGDLVAMVHLFDLPVKHPEKMKSSLEHLEAVIDQSRRSWLAIQAETDNDAEWVPNADQQAAVPGWRMTKQQIDGWHQFLAEAESILAGEKLIPFWRFKQGTGINLRRVFTEPRRFDLVLWAQGTGALPYVEEGVVTEPDTWRRLQRIFQGEFFGFALWIN